MKDLINLRHLHLEGCGKIKYMPRGMGQLKHLKTLSLFVIGNESDSCQLDELKELNIRGSLKILNLERVSDASIARGISMSKMSSIDKLELFWEDDTNSGQKKTRHEKIGEALEVSTTCLKTLIISGCNGVNIPKWMSTSYDIGMPVLFPLLEELEIKDMKNLRELVSPPPITTNGAFPNLSRIMINNCPKLGALSPHLKSLKNVNIGGECPDELLHSISNMSSLTNLFLYDMGERSVLFPAANNNEALMFDDDDEISTLAVADNNEALPGGRSAFQSLRRLEIFHCSKLRCLFDEECEEELAAAARGRGERERTRSVLTNDLHTLVITDCPELMISVEQWRNLITHNSLEYLVIFHCPKLVPSKVEEAAEVIALLRSLRARLPHHSLLGDFLPEEAEEEENVFNNT